MPCLLPHIVLCVQSSHLPIWFGASGVIAKFQFHAFIKKVITSFSFLKALLTSPLKYANLKTGLKLN